MIGVEVVASWRKGDFFIFKNVSAQAAVVEAVDYIDESFDVGAEYFIFAVVLLTRCIQAAEDGLTCQRTLVLPCSELNSESLEQL